MNLNTSDYRCCRRLDYLVLHWHCWITYAQVVHTIMPLSWPWAATHKSLKAIAGCVWSSECNTDSEALNSTVPVWWTGVTGSRFVMIYIITVQHGSADTVVRAMNAFNGKCRFSGYDSYETPWPIFKKIGTVDYVGDPTPHASLGINRFKGGVSAHAWNCRPQASIFFSLFFLI